MPRDGSEMHDGRWELVKKHVRGFLWCALVCAPSPVLASPVRIWIRLLNECAVGVHEEGEAPAVAPAGQAGGRVLGSSIQQHAFLSARARAILLPLRSGMATLKRRGADPLLHAGAVLRIAEDTEI